MKNLKNVVSNAIMCLLVVLILISFFFGNILVGLIFIGFAACMFLDEKIDDLFEFLEKRNQKIVEAEMEKEEAHE